MKKNCTILITKIENKLQVLLEFQCVWYQKLIRSPKCWNPETFSTLGKQDKVNQLLTWIWCDSEEVWQVWKRLKDFEANWIQIEKDFKQQKVIIGEARYKGKRIFCLTQLKWYREEGGILLFIRTSSMYCPRMSPGKIGQTCWVKVSLSAPVA